MSGGRTADGKASPNLWATTNGTAWLIVGGKAQAGVSAVSQSQAYVESQKRIYRFVSLLVFSLSRSKGFYFCSDSISLSSFF